MSASKVNFIIFCDIQDVILNHFVPPKTNDTGNYYATVCKSELWSAFKRKRPQLQKSEILMHHDNAQSESSRVVSDTVKELDIELLPHPSYSPDLAISRLAPVLKTIFHQCVISYTGSRTSPPPRTSAPL